MRNTISMLKYFGIFGLVPVYLAMCQKVPTRFSYQHVVLLVSLGAFGLVLGQFWLSRLRTHRPGDMKAGAVLKWHKVLGYVVGGILLLHPLFVIGRRFVAEESDPIENLLIALKAPALLPAVIAWILLASIVLLSLPVSRRSMRARSWRLLHDIVSALFVGLATWHVVAVGRHSSGPMSAYWIILAAVAIGLLVRARLPHRSRQRRETKEMSHESLQ